MPLFEWLKVLLHQFWVKKSRNMFPTTRKLQIRVHFYRPRHCFGDWLNFRLFCSDDCRSWSREGKFWSDDCRSWPRDEKINNHGCWGKHAHIPDNDYWEISQFHVVWTHFFLQLFLCGTHGIYIFFSSTEHCAWAIISQKEFKSWVTRISFALLYWKTELSAIKYFANCS